MEKPAENHLLITRHEPVPSKKLWKPPCSIGFGAKLISTYLDQDCNEYYQ